MTTIDMKMLHMQLRQYRAEDLPGRYSFYVRRNRTGQYAGLIFDTNGSRTIAKGESALYKINVRFK